MNGRRLLLVALPALAAVLLAAGCGGGDDESSADAWANDVCTSVTTWTDQLVTSVESLGGGNLSRDAVSAAVDDVSEATDTLESDLSDLGAPDTECGADAEEAVSTLVDPARGRRPGDPDRVRGRLDRQRGARCGHGRDGDRGHDVAAGHDDVHDARRSRPGR